MSIGAAFLVGGHAAVGEWRQRSKGAPTAQPYAAPMTTEISYAKWMLPLSVPFGLGPKHSEVQVRDGALHVAMGWGFTAEIPLASITQARRWEGRITSWGVHGFRGRWLVNGSSDGVVALTIDPPVKAKVCGVPVTLRQLGISVTDPDALIAAVNR